MGANLTNLRNVYQFREAVKLDPGDNKYIIIKITFGKEAIYFVRSKKWAKYHKDIFNKFYERMKHLKIKGVSLRSNSTIECIGGGFIKYKRNIFF